MFRRLGLLHCFSQNYVLETGISSVLNKTRFEDRLLLCLGDASALFRLNWFGDRDIRSILGSTCEAQRIVCCGTILIKTVTRTERRIECVAAISVYSEIKVNCSNRIKFNAVELTPIFILGANFDILVFRPQSQ